MSHLRLLAVAGVLAAPLAAQQPPHQHQQHGQQGARQDHGAMMQAMMAPMQQAMAFMPARLLERSDSLALTPQQVARLTALRDAARTAHDAARADAHAHRDALVEAMAIAAPDTAAVRRHFQAAHAAMGSAHWAMLRAAAQAKAVLTDAQRARVGSAEP